MSSFVVPPRYLTYEYTTAVNTYNEDWEARYYNASLESNGDDPEMVVARYFANPYLHEDVKGATTDTLVHGPWNTNSFNVVKPLDMSLARRLLRHDGFSASSHVDHTGAWKDWIWERYKLINLLTHVSKDSYVPIEGGTDNKIQAQIGVSAKLTNDEYRQELGSDPVLEESDTSLYCDFYSSDGICIYHDIKICFAASASDFKFEYPIYIGVYTRTSGDNFDKLRVADAGIVQYVLGNSQDIADFASDEDNQYQCEMLWQEFSALLEQHKQDTFSTYHKLDDFWDACDRSISAENNYGTMDCTGYIRYIG
jgi:hypothetical protein